MSNEDQETQDPEVMDCTPPKFSAMELTGPDGKFIFPPGQKISCTVIATEEGGYSVTVSDKKYPGYLPTSKGYAIGSVISARFICISQGRFLMRDAS